MNTSEGKKLLSEWQKRLGLHDWRIVFEDNCIPEAMGIQGAMGCSLYTEESKCGHIQILDEKYYHNEIPFDYEAVMVHELLHLKLALLMDETNDLRSRVTHQIIDDLARAFVDAKRKGVKEEKS